MKQAGQIASRPRRTGAPGHPHDMQEAKRSPSLATALISALLVLGSALGTACQLPFEPGAPLPPDVPPPPPPDVPPDVPPAPGFLVIDRESWDFGLTHVTDTSPEMSFTVRNGGPRAISGLVTHLTQDVGFTITATTCAGWLEPSATCTIAVAFAPLLAGPVEADLLVDAGDLRARTTLTGTAAATLRVDNLVYGALVESEPAGISCSWYGGACEITLTIPEITLQASLWSDPGYAFWDGPCESNDGGPCRVRLDADVTVALRLFETDLLWYESGDVPNVLAVDPDDNLIVADLYGYYLFKYAADGALLWQREQTALSDIAVDASGNLGIIDQFGVIQKLDGAGAPQWSADVAPGGFWVGAVEFDPDGNLLAAGTVQISDSEMFVRVQKYSASGALLWTREHAPRPWSYVHGLAVDQGGNVILSGQGQAHFDEDGSFFPEVRFLHKYDRSGDLTWADENAPVTEWVGVGADGDIFVAGPDWSVYSTRYLIEKRAPDGALVWQAAEDYTYNNQVTVSPAGDVFSMTGHASGYDTAPVIRVRKLSGATGAWQPALWIPRDGDMMLGRDIVVTASGNVIVGGVTTEPEDNWSEEGWLRAYDAALFDRPSH